MAGNNIPSGLKAADISRFAMRASQLEQAKPVIAYWCNYWIVNQILAKGLHNSGEDCMKYTTDLMDKLERFKSENAGNDAITDDVAGQAYVEEFGLDTFQRADNAVRANKASRQTADTFQAAATFLELGNIWGNLSPEISAKVKFAKYHALRIAKAIKAGEDPNLSNPTQESEEGQGEEEVALDPNDPEVQALQDPNGSAPPPATRGRQPSVEEIPDDFDRVQHRLAQQSSLDESLHPSRASSNPPRPESNMNLDGGRPVDASNFYSGAVPDLPAAPSDYPQASTSPSILPDAPSASNLGGGQGGFPSSDTLHSFPPPAPTQFPSDQRVPPQQPPSDYGRDMRPPAPPVNAPHALQQARQAPQPVARAQPQAAPAPANQVVDEESIALAQKHARWAVSALNFEDVNTAIKELNNSLRYLGA